MTAGSAIETFFVKNLGLELEVDRSDICYPKLTVNGRQLKEDRKSACRAVFIQPPFIFKADRVFEDARDITKARNSEVYNQCHLEYEFFTKMLQNKDRKYFAPILYFNRKRTKNRGLLVMPYYPPRPGRHTQEAADIIERLMHEYLLYDICYLSNKRRNWLVQKNGDPLIYDYGIVG